MEEEEEEKVEEEKEEVGEMVAANALLLGYIADSRVESCDHTVE